MRKFSNTQVNKAGKILKNRKDYSIEEVIKAENILTYWRLIHSPLITTFQALLRTKISKKHNGAATIAQRIKRSPSILLKLQRFPNMQLSTMQDIAGIRAIMQNVNDVYTLSNELKRSNFKHKCVNEFDYIKEPKESGYRSIHIIFEYNNPKIEASNGLKIEVQIRSRLQHIWATSVETMGTFLQTSLKSSEGPKDILDFFSITSSAFAQIEKTNLYSNYLNLFGKKIFEEVIKQFHKLKIKDKLSAFTIAANHIHDDKTDARFYLLTLDVKNHTVTIRSYLQSEFEQANIEYTETERHINAGAELQVVLVSLESINTLKKAFPNYFLDTREFIRKIEGIQTKLEKANN